MWLFIDVCVFADSPLLNGDAVHDDGVGNFDLFFNSGGDANNGPLYRSLICYLALSTNDAV